MAKPSSKLAKVRGPFVEHVRRDKLLERYNGCCGICGEKVNANTFTVDHIIPISKGGVHAYYNCQPTHAFCNVLKGNLLPSQFDFHVELTRRKRKKKKYRNDLACGKQKSKKARRASPKAAKVR